MAKQGALASNFYIGGFDLSGNVNALSKISGGPAALELTPINVSAYVRAGGLRDGGMDFTTLFDSAAGQEHAALSPLVTTDQVMSFFVGPLGIGNPAASLNAKQVNYDPTRASDGSFIFAVAGQGNGFGLEWGQALTPGLRTDGAATAAGAGNSFDTGASLAFGAQMYVHLIAFTGTSVTIKVQDSADNITFNDIAGTSLTTTALTVAGTATSAVRVAIPNTTTVRRYIAVGTVGTFSNAVFAVNVNKNPVAGVAF
jgi:hypothetical protein